MLTPEDKKRIEAEEGYRAEIRGRQKPIRTRSFTDTMNRVRFWAAVIVTLLFAAVAYLLFQPVR